MKTSSDKLVSPLFISYLRVSTSRQGVSGLGLEAQRAAVQTQVAHVGGQLLKEFVEVESGKVRDRPILHQALAHCRSTGAVLVIAKLDRLARNVAFVSSLMEARTEFVACDFPAANRLMIHILAAFAEHEREQIAARTKAALAAAKARGVRLGVNGAVLAEQRKGEASEHAESLRSILSPLAGRGLKLQDFADRLNGFGIVTREGASWCPTTVRRVLIRLGLHPTRNGTILATQTTLASDPGPWRPIPSSAVLAVPDGPGDRGR